MSDIGLSRREIEARLHKKIASDPDLKYYLSDEYVIKLVDLLIKGIAEVIEENNQQAIDNIVRKIPR